VRFNEKKKLRRGEEGVRENYYCAGKLFRLNVKMDKIAVIFEKVKSVFVT